MQASLNPSAVFQHILHSAVHMSVLPSNRFDKRQNSLVEPFTSSAAWHLGSLASWHPGVLLKVSHTVHRGEAIRTGFLLSQGGEFAFVLLSLAKELKVPIKFPLNHVGEIHSTPVIGSLRSVQTLCIDVVCYWKLCITRFGIMLTAL